MNNKVAKLTLSASMIARFRRVVTVLLLIPLLCYGQNDTRGGPQQTRKDSLRQELGKAKHDTDICFLYQLIGKEFYLEMPDSAIYYWTRSLEHCEKSVLKYKTGSREFMHLKKNCATNLNNIGYLLEQQGKNTGAVENYQKALKISSGLNDKEGIATAYNNIGYEYMERGDLNNAFYYFQRTLGIAREMNDLNGLAITLNNLGKIRQDQGDLAAALEHYYESLKLEEKLNNDQGTISCLNNIAFIYEDQHEYEKALEKYKKAMLIAEKIRDKNKQARTINNMAAIMETTGKKEQAMEYYLKSLRLAEELKDVKVQAMVLGNLGLLTSRSGNRAVALRYYQQSLTMREEIADIKGIVNSLCNIGHLYYDGGEFEKAHTYAKNAMTTAGKVGHVTSIKSAAELLYFTSKKRGQYMEALEHFELYIKMRDSLNNERNRKAAIKSALRYEYEKQAAADSVAHAKETDIKNSELAKQEAQIRAKKNQQYVLFGGLALVMIFAGSMFNRYKVTQKQKNIIELQKSEVEKQKLLVEQKQTEILDSIHYAKRIQLAQIPNEKRVFKMIEQTRK